MDFPVFVRSIDRLDEGDTEKKRQRKKPVFFKFHFPAPGCKFPFLWTLYILPREKIVLAGETPPPRFFVCFFLSNFFPICIFRFFCFEWTAQGSCRCCRLLNVAADLRDNIRLHLDYVSKHNTLCKIK